MRKTGLSMGIALVALMGVAAAQPPVNQQHFAAEAVARDAASYAASWHTTSGALGEFSAQTVNAIVGNEGFINLRELRREASYGNPDAEAALGLFHLTSTGEAYDPIAAFAYNSAAAEAGMPVAQTSLGLQYLNGVGTTRDTAKAEHWFEVAAKGGHTQAAYQTGVMYLEGEGVEDDSLMARYWLLRARENGDRRATRLLADFATF